MRLSRRHVLAGVAATVLTACATPQTLVPYTPAAGVNNGPNAENPDPGDDRYVAVRNLLIIATGAGTGYLSGSLASRDQPVSLRDVAGAPIRQGGAAGTAFVVSGGTRLAIPRRTLVVLTDEPSIQLRSPDLVAGLTAEVVLTFDQGDAVRLQVPVYPPSLPGFATVTPRR